MTIDEQIALFTATALHLGLTRKLPCFTYNLTDDLFTATYPIAGPIKLNLHFVISNLNAIPKEEGTTDLAPRICKMLNKELDYLLTLIKLDSTIPELHKAIDKLEQNKNIDKSDAEYMHKTLNEVAKDVTPDKKLKITDLDFSDN